MSGTPRLRSAFPSTPQHDPSKNPPRHGVSPKASPRSPPQVSSPKLPDVNTLHASKPDLNSPLISTNTLDAPTQRFYVASIWVLLLAWRLWDFWHLTIDEQESLWLFMKWVAIDSVFLFGLPGLRIPWLEWTSATMTVLFLLHAFVDGILMFRIPIPFGAWLAGIAKLLYNSEISVSERRVKPAKLLHDTSHYLGDSITVHVLPEGSAILNPRNIPLCLDAFGTTSSAAVEIQINQTNPIEIQLIRFDLDGTHNETMSISSSQIKKLRKEAARVAHWESPNPLTIKYALQKTGLYRLSRVIDETHMDVHTRSSDALVVACPSAKIISSETNRCRGELSNMAIEVNGTPPLKIWYRKTVNQEDRDVSYSSIQPEDFVSPLQRQRESLPLVTAGFQDLSWAASHRIIVPLNETLEKSGTWTYSIEKVTDALNNEMKYVVVDDFGARKANSPHSEGSLFVHDRPMVALGASVQKPLRAAIGREIELPLRFSSTAAGRKAIGDAQHTVHYLFTPTGNHSTPGESSVATLSKEITLVGPHYKHNIKEPGLYSLHSVSTQFCAGEILEPATCMLINPPPPSMITSPERITDKCAGRQIGLMISLDFVGSPPFTVTWREYRDRNSNSFKVHERKFDGSRGQLELKPHNAGFHRYAFAEISDQYYKGRSLLEDVPLIEQDVRPSVNAKFTDNTSKMKTVCPEQSVNFGVELLGEGPWTLEYEMIHSTKRNAFRIEKIDHNPYTISTPILKEGGEHTFALVSVTDRAGCKELLKDEAKVFVRHQRPRASFGKLEGKQTVRILAGKGVELPVRLSGDGPWTVDYKQSNDNSRHSKTFKAPNDFINVRAPATYEILEVKDAHCPGIVEVSGKKFEVVGIERPSLAVIESPLFTKLGNVLVRKEVCEGDEDALDIQLEGRPPFAVKYQEHINIDRGQKSLRAMEMNVALHTAQIKMDTQKPGLYEYVFTELSDDNYDHDSKQHREVKVQQRVNSKPSAAFLNPGKVYSFCQGRQSERNEEIIPITFSGQPPFTIHLEFKQSSRTSRAIPVTFSNIMTTTYDLHIPNDLLLPGNSFLSIRRVRDGRGCERQLDLPPVQGSAAQTSTINTIPRVQISVHDPPTISATEPSKVHYCVGEHLSYTLSGLAPFSVFYTFGGKSLKASVTSPIFRRIAESPGNFTITGISDAASSCQGAASPDLKYIHPLPSVKVSHGRDKRVDIHAGGAAELHLEFGGTPPFEFTYIRSETRKGKGGAAGKILETKTMTAEGFEARIRAGDEGTYEVISLRDRFCSVARPGTEGIRGANGAAVAGAAAIAGAELGAKLLMDG